MNFDLSGMGRMVTNVYRKSTQSAKIAKKFTHELDTIPIDQKPTTLANIINRIVIATQGHPKNRISALNHIKQHLITTVTDSSTLTQLITDGFSNTTNKEVQAFFKDVQLEQLTSLLKRLKWPV